MAKNLKSRIRLDVTDMRLLRLLENDGRTSIADLARALHLSAPSTSDRLKRLEASGVIRRFTIEIDHARLGYGLDVHIRIRPFPGALAKVATLIADLPEIVACDRITGDDCYVARAAVTDVGALERLIDKITPWAQTHTAIVQSSPVRRRLPGLRGEPTA